MPSHDERPPYCLHQHHPNAAIEAKAREIYMARYSQDGGWWELNETPQCWWAMAKKALVGEPKPGLGSTKNLPIDAEPF